MVDSGGISGQTYQVNTHHVEYAGSGTEVAIISCVLLLDDCVLTQARSTEVGQSPVLALLYLTARTLTGTIDIVKAII